MITEILLAMVLLYIFRDNIREIILTLKGEKSHKESNQEKNKKVYVLIHKNDLSNIDDSLKWIFGGYEQGTVFLSEESAKNDDDYQSSIEKGFILKAVDIKILD